MACIKDLFIETINKGIKTAEMIPDASNKAMAFAELAKALALTGQLRNSTGVELSEPTGKEALKPAVGKGKAKTSKKDKVVEEPIAEPVELPEEVVEEEVVVDVVVPEDEQIVEELVQEAQVEADAINEEEFTEEWTDYSLEALANEIEFMNQVRDAWGEETISECIAVFSEGLYNKIDDINPLNIKGFVSYMQSCLNDAQNAEE